MVIIIYLNVSSNRLTTRTNHQAAVHNIKQSVWYSTQLQFHTDNLYLMTDSCTLYNTKLNGTDSGYCSNRAVGHQTTVTVQTEQSDTKQWLLFKQSSRTPNSGYCSNRAVGHQTAVTVQTEHSDTRQRLLFKQSSRTPNNKLPGPFTVYRTTFVFYTTSLTLPDETQSHIAL
jgi:hypothetical protein